MLKPLHILMNDEPGAAGGGSPAPDPAPADLPPVDAGTPAEPAPPAAPEAPPEPFAGLDKMLDAVGKDQDPASAGQPRDAMGRFAPLDAAPPAPTPAPTAAPAAQAPAAPKPGEVDLTPPEGMTERAQQRWAQLTERAKQVPELERRATEATTQLESVRQMVASSGLSQEEFSEMLNTGRLLKSNSPQELQQALQRLDDIRADLAMRLGVEVPGVDALAAHPDLKAKVDGLILSREDALEIARLRPKAKQADTLTAEQREMQQFQQTVQGAAASMEKTLAALANTPGHEQKVQYIHAYFSKPENLQAFVQTYQPQQWQAALQMMYQAYNPPVPPAPPPGPQPLRPGNVRSGMPTRSGPVTAESAVAGAFDRLGL